MPVSFLTHTNPITKAADIARRTLYARNQTVVLILQNDIVLSAPLKFDIRYSCTVVLSAVTPGYTISLPTDTAPVLFLNSGVNNVLFNGVSFTLPLTANSSRTACSFAQITVTQNGQQPCPAIFIGGAFDVQITGGTVFGRIDLHDAYYITIDSMKLTSLPAGINVRVGTGCGNSNGLGKSFITITNNEIYKGDIGVLLAGSSTGVTVNNNYCHDLHWACVQVGLGITNVADSQMHTVMNNFIVVKPGDKGTDAAGIYFATHWYNPGNYISCNYVIGGEHCIYVDYASSGLVIDGAVCVNTTNGVKQNNGKANNISSVLTINPKNVAGWISCQNFDLNNCNKVPGTIWVSRGQAKYANSPLLKTNPWFATMCTDTHINGVECNPPNSTYTAADSAKCSGLPTANKHHFVMVNPVSNHLPYFPGCDGLPSIPDLNDVTWSVHRGASVEADNFVDPKNLDYALKPNAPILAANPDFKSCPRSAAGPQRVSEDTYFAQYNIYRVGRKY
eukprot:SM000068S20582  [mRNA]  locus=s68:335688:337798:+ [translate_table: standard]